jgi:MFS family permease
MQNFEKNNRLLNTLFVGNFISQIGGFICIPFLAMYLAKIGKSTPAEIGFVIGLQPLTMAISSFFAGSLSDRFGRSAVLLVCALSRIAIYAGFACSHEVWQFALLNAINGIATAGMGPVTKALIADCVPTESKPRLFGRFYISTNIAAGLGPVLGASLAAKTSLQVSFFGATALNAVYAVFLIVVFQKVQLPKPVTTIGNAGVGISRAIKVLRADRTLIRYVAFLFCISAAYAQHDSTLVQVMSSARTLSFLFLINACCVVFFQGVLQKWLRPFSLRQGVWMGSILIGLGLIGFGVSGSHFIFLALSMVVFTVGEIFEFLSSNMLVDQLAPSGLRGAYFGATQFRHLGRFIGPPVGGFLLSHAGRFSAFFGFGVPLILVAASLLLRDRKMPPAESGQLSV